MVISQDAVTLEMIRQNHDRQTSQSSDASAVLHRVVFIDSTWQQCHRIITVSISHTLHPPPPPPPPPPPTPNPGFGLYTYASSSEYDGGSDPLIVTIHSNLRFGPSAGQALKPSHSPCVKDLLS